MGFIRSRRLVIMPVSPIPPAVAWKSGSAGVTVTSEPSARSMVKSWTCWEKVPSPVWFLPWMSSAESAAHGDEPGAGRDRDEPPCGHTDAQEVVNAHPGADIHDLTWLADLVQAERLQHGAAAVLRGVSVGASESASDHRVGGGDHSGRLPC